MKQKNYSYLNVQGMYICIERNTFSLTWLLLCKTKPFNLHVPAHNRFVRLLPGSCTKAIRVINIIGKVLLHKYISKNKNLENNEWKLSPHKGHILINTSNGYKVFDLNKNLVITQYQPKIKRSAFKRIMENSSKLEKYSLSPKNMGVDKEKLCMYEEYVNLYKAERFYPITPYFYTSILPVWQRNITRFKGRNTELTTYVQNHRSYIFKRLDSLGNQQNDEVILEIKSYIDNLVNKIIQQYNATGIYLTLSHGDLHAWNILMKNNESVLIDWDTAKERSFLHDFYYMFFHNIFGKKNIDFNIFVKELKKSLKKIKSEKMIEMVTDFNEELYRQLFYLEYIFLDLEKRMDTYTEEKSKNNFVEKLYSYIKVFKEADLNYGKNGREKEMNLDNILREAE